MYEGVNLNFEYWTTFYYSVLIFTVNDISTTVTIERIFIAYMGIFSSIVNANIFGIITILIQDMKKKDICFREEMACITAVLDSNALFHNDNVGALKNAPDHDTPNHINLCMNFHHDYFRNVIKKTSERIARKDQRLFTIYSKKQGSTS
jgi:hypothetical protein